MMAGCSFVRCGSQSVALFSAPYTDFCLDQAIVSIQFRLLVPWSSEISGSFSGTGEPEPSTVYDLISISNLRWL